MVSPTFPTEEMKAKMRKVKSSMKKAKQEKIQMEGDDTRE